MEFREEPVDGVRRRHAARLRVEHYDDPDLGLGARIRDDFGGATYRVVGERTGEREVRVVSLTIRPDQGVAVGDLRWNERQLAVLAVETAESVERMRTRDAAANAEIARRQRDGLEDRDVRAVSTTFNPGGHPRPDPKVREQPAPTWVASVVQECRALGVPSRSTIAALRGVTGTTVDRWVAAAVELGLLERGAPNRPRRPIRQETPDA